MTTRDIVLIALFAALMAVLGIFPPLTVPLIAVPITAQSLGPMLAGGILGAKRGALSMALFLVLVAVGLPLLSGGRGGLGVFAGPTAGFLFGWIVAAAVIGWLTERSWRSLGPVTAFLNCVIGGIVVLYAIGIPALAFIAGIPLWTALSGSAPFLPGDFVKAAVAALVIVALKRSYPLVEARG
ncbi:biotin transporter BioY [Fulvimarina endophytica]|uniref:Biotin transporter n=1 Tax=Fulvimarina endophytica TaxID=2293836 RepID=A0A371X3F7_9HYPH|nr:biotin transporter BioY [Fulvimarina endophytica]RFC63752.1 biotin transporter BioY [Fulvimarina endophytica]